MSRIVKHITGDIDVILLTDGVGSFPAEVFLRTDPGDIDHLLKAAGKSAIETNFNAALIRTPTETILFDTGGRDTMGPNLGHLHDALAEAEVRADEIDTVFLSHMHGDHCAGAITATGQAVFPKARLVLTEPEFNWWNAPANFAPKGERAIKAQAQAAAVFKAYGDRMRLTNGNEAVTSGVSVEPIHGHTPGHSGLHIESNGQEFLLVGDIVHAVDIQLPNPEAGVMYDWDYDMAAAARKRMLDRLATDGTPCSGGHFLYPAVGRIERAGQGYRLIQ